ncbi:MAG: hypothetical protein JJE51_06760 [Thermoanaerobaculia bacterium]|nr:hypothetical protein [Thermoanaerobaculia bacterium]
MPVIVIAALVATAALILPTGAIGDVRRAPMGIATDSYAFNRNALISKPVSGSVQVFSGSADVQDVIDGDLLVFGGDVRFSGAGRVNGNVIYAGGTVSNATGRVGGRVYALASVEGAAASITSKAIALSLLFLWIIAAILLTLLSGREIRLSSVEIRSSALHCFALGLVAFTSFVLTAIVFSYLIQYLVGIPLLAALAVFGVLTKIYGMVAVFHAIGTLVAGAKTREQLTSRKWLRGDLAMVVIGVVILGAIRMIPVIGTLTWSVASIFGIGVALGTRFGRRDPWFLAWRAAEA